MAFWSSQEITAKGQSIITPFREERIDCNAYKLSLGNEYSTSAAAEKRINLAAGEQISIPPGQFAQLITEEEVHVPEDAMAFISVRYSKKMLGLVNISGFHVDPGYVGKLQFSVYNAGSRPIPLTVGDAVFSIWFADLRQGGNTYPQGKGRYSITDDVVAKTYGPLASPEQLRSQVDELRRWGVVLIWLAGVLLVPLYIALIGAFLTFAVEAVRTTWEASAAPPNEQTSALAPGYPVIPKLVAVNENRGKRVGTAGSQTQQIQLTCLGAVRTMDSDLLLNSYWPFGVGQNGHRREETVRALLEQMR